MNPSPALGLLLALLPPAADEAPADSDEAARRLATMKEAVAGYGIVAGAEGGRALALAADPVLRFHDDVTGVIDGAVFLWRGEDRPEVAMSIWYRPGYCHHEFQSLSTQPLVAEEADVVHWNPAEPGVVFRPLEGAKAPAADARQRLTQMRALSRRFAAAVSDSTAGRQELRLLTQPLDRYGAEEGPVADGGLFAFAKGTNPEVLLLIEARRDADGSLRWEYAPARMSARECELTCDGDPVWHVPFRNPQAEDEVYFNRVLRTDADAP